MNRRGFLTLAAAAPVAAPMAAAAALKPAAKVTTLRMDMAPVRDALRQVLANMNRMFSPAEIAMRQMADANVFGIRSDPSVEQQMKDHDIFVS